MTFEQLEERVRTNEQTLAAFNESLKSAHKRIDENDALISQIHKLATSIEMLAFQVKVQGDRLEDMVSKQQAQGKKIDTLEKKPALRWEALTTTIIGFTVAAILGAIVSKLTQG